MQLYTAFGEMMADDDCGYWYHRSDVDARIAELEKRSGIDFLFLWMTTPNPMLGGTKPLDMLRLGRGQKLYEFIKQAMEDEAAAQKARSLMVTGVSK